MSTVVEREVWIDTLKGVLIMLVVLGHCIQYTDTDFENNVAWCYIYSFHMPLLFLGVK